MDNKQILDELKLIANEFSRKKNQQPNYIEFIKNWKSGIIRLDKLIIKLEKQIS